MRLSLDSLEDFCDEVEAQEKEDYVESVISKSSSLEDEIKLLDKKLDRFKDERKSINTLKIEKDKRIVKYIESIRIPKTLDIQLINYKALLFYFIETFANGKYLTLGRNDYKNTKIDIEYKLERLDILFDSKNNNAIKINVTILNFPHLIGYNDDTFEFDGEEIKEKSTKIEFIRNILYESDLTHDYEKDGCDTNKIEAFAWILRTLKKPTYILQGKSFFQNEDGTIDETKSAIRKKQFKLKADIIFVSFYSGIYHYVSLKKHINSLDNEYYINSHHHMEKEAYEFRFDKNYTLYHYKKPKS